MTSPAHPLLPAAELPPGRHRVITVNGVAVGVFHLANGAGFRAYVDFCPHAGAPLCHGPQVAGPDGRPALRCPWHGWEFDLEMGTHLRNPRCRLDALTVAVDEAGNLRVQGSS